MKKGNRKFTVDISRVLIGPRSQNSIIIGRDEQWQLDCQEYPTDPLLKLSADRGKSLLGWDPNNG